MGKTRKIRKATYLNNFKCIGVSCEDNCCIGWSVEIDKKTFAKYKNLKDQELNNLVKKYVYINEDCYDSNVDYGLVELKKNKHCPFLNESKLCKIQAKSGESYLSNVCATYPRIANEINGVTEYSATVSCPEAARLILGMKEGLHFKNDEEDVKIRNIVSISADLTRNDGIYSDKYLLELREFTIFVLQSRNFFLWERILILGLCLQKVQDKFDNNKGEEMPVLLNYLENKINSNGFKNETKILPDDQYQQFEILKVLSDKYNNPDEIDSAEYLSFINEFNKGITKRTNNAKKTLNSSYKESYLEYYRPFMNKNEYLLENYLVNYVFQSLFPVAENVSAFYAFENLVIRYSLIKFFLTGIGEFRNGLTETLVIEFIQSFSKALEHNYSFFEKIGEYMKNNKYNTIELMSVLVKN